jgi:hypothetical protein
MSASTAFLVDMCCINNKSFISSSSLPLNISLIGIHYRYCFRCIFLTLKNFCNSLLVDFTVTKLRFLYESAQQ